MPISYAYYTSIRRISYAYQKCIICVLYEYQTAYHTRVIRVLYAYHMQEYVKKYVSGTVSNQMLDMKALHYAF